MAYNSPPYLDYYGPLYLLHVYSGWIGSLDSAWVHELHGTIYKLRTLGLVFTKPNLWK